jgi:type VI protein secretion system component Hcp
MSTTFLFLKLTANGARINGDSTEKHFESQIALDSLGWEFSCSHEPVNDTRDKNAVKTTNRPKRVTLGKAFDRSTTNLCTLMAQRKPFSEAVIMMVKGFSSGDRPRTLIDVILTNGYVESVSLTASESGLSVAVKESVTLSFQKMKIVYHPDSPTGVGDAPATEFILEVPSEVE